MLNHLWFYWSRRGYYYEGGELASRAMHQTGEYESVDLCVALSSASVMFSIQGQFAKAESLAHRAVTMARRLEDPEALIAALGTYSFFSVNADQALGGLHEGIALIQETGKKQEMLPLMYLGAATWLHSSGRYAQAKEYYRKSIVLFRQLGVVDFTADPLGRLGQLALVEGRYREAYDLTVESISAARLAENDVVFSAWGSARLGLIQLYLGEIESAQRSLEQALLFFEDARSYDRPKLETLANLSEVALARGDVKAASDYLHASLQICTRFYRQLQSTQKLEGTPDSLPVDLIGLCARASLVAAAEGDDERAVTLYSIADSIRSQSRQLLIPALKAQLEETMAAIHSHLSERSIDVAWERGQSMSLSEAFAFLLA